jgi:cytochrome P450
MATAAVADPPVPAHVPLGLVRDIDYLSPGDATGESDPLLAWKKIKDTSPAIFWTPRYGGHWVFTQAEDIETAQLDHERFSMRGHSIPMNITPNVPLELDPPEHGPVRAMLSPFFAPKVVKGLTDNALEITTALIDEIQPRGKCEFVEDFARQLPIILFLNLVDLPLEDRKMLLDLGMIRTRGRDADERNAAKLRLLEYLSGVIAERKAAKGDDLLSNMLHGKVSGEPLSHEMSQNLLAQLMFAGLDTVANMLGFVARALALDPALRHRLIAEPDLIPKAFDELARRHSVVCMARLVTQDMDYKGVQLKAGEQVLIPNILHSFDEKRFDNPLAIDLERKNAAKHVTFGNGPHRCPGAVLARAETRVFLEQWLRRIPDFEIDPEDEVQIDGGRVIGMTRLPLRWNV